MARRKKSQAFCSGTRSGPGPVKTDEHHNGAGCDFTDGRAAFYMRQAVGIAQTSTEKRFHSVYVVPADLKNHNHRLFC